MTSPWQGAQRVDASMTLITEMMERPLDPGYAAAARVREEAGLPPSTGQRSVLLIAFAVLVGILLATSAAALRAPATAATKTRADLVAQIESRRARADEQAKRIAELRVEIDAAQEIALRLHSQGSLADQLERVEYAAGALPVTGPGLTVTVDDAEQSAGSQAPDVNPRTGPAPDQGRVLARDLQIVVNGLWEAGAEAVAVNGHRLTAQSAIRFAGEAILVDYRPLTRPYVITAIGDPDHLGVAFAETDAGSYLQSLKSNYHIRGDVKDSTGLTLPGVASLALRVAQPVIAATSRPSTTTQSSPRTQSSSRARPPTSRTPVTAASIGPGPPSTTTKDAP